MTRQILPAHDLQLRNGTFELHGAAIHDDNAVADCRDVVDQVRAEHDNRVAKAANNASKVKALARIQPDRRLVEKHQPRSADDSPGNAGTLTHPAG